RWRHANLRVEWQDRLQTYPTLPTWPAMTHVERTVFSNPRTMTSAPDTTGFEILAGGRQIGEIELIGRRIKRLLLGGDGTSGGRPVRPGQIVVVFRQPQRLADLVSEVFQRLEIPFFLENGRALSRSPAIVMLLRLLELDTDDWPMYKLLGVLGNNYFAPAWVNWNDRAASLTERTIRKLQIPRGRQRLLEQLEWLAQTKTSNESLQSLMSLSSARLERMEPSEEAAIAHEILRHLASALDQLPRYDTLAAYAPAWTQLADHVGILRSMQRGLDEVAWNQLHETLRESQQLAAWLDQDAPRLDRKQAREALLDILGNQTLGVANEEPGRVRVLSAASVRHLRIPYLFLAGLSERSFPAADRSDGVYSEAEYQRLIEAGLPLPSRSERQTDEMLLFYETITSATRRLYLSYPAIDESGEPLTPSPYLKEVEQACGSTPIARFEQIDLSPVPNQRDLCSIDAFRARAVFDAIQGKAEPLAGFVQYCNAMNSVLHSNSAAQSVLRGLEFSLARQNRDRFGASEGMLGKAAARRLEADIPPDRIFSATELERYAYCPYQFFLNKVLNVQPLEEVELEVDYMQRGQMAHEFLAAFHRRVNQSGGGPESPVTLAPTEYERLLAEAIAETLSQPGRDSLAGAFREIDRRVLLQWLRSYRQQHEKYDAQWKDCDRPPCPALFEISFGKTLRAADGPPSTSEPLELVSHGRVVRLAGRIDRIDVGEVHGQTVFNILDYKTGSGTRFSLEACQRGTALQLPLYAMAATELILNDRDALPWHAGYWYLSGDGFKPRQALRMYELVEDHLDPSETWESIRGILADTVVGLVNAIRRGEFPVWSDDPDCTGRCPYKTVCRINQIRSLEKTWRPSAP
ncbi:MAG: PD-(D/E)XK nuclease family protein, partial [Thermoguttaceae bacterium]